jgi:SAM-dependent methyltransferase
MEEKIQCPICKWKGKKFLDLIGKYGRINSNAQCPICRSYQRHRLLYFYLKKILDKNINKDKIKLLHFAPEECISKFIKSNKNINYISADLNQNSAMRKEDITSLSFNDNFFDIIICSHVLEHIEDDRQAVREIYRVLKPGGIAIIIVPQDLKRESTYENDKVNSEEEREKEFWYFEHLRLYGRDFKKRIEKSGLKLKEEFSSSNLTPEDSRKFGLANSIICCFTK